MIESGVAFSTAVYGGSMGLGMGGAFLIVRWLATFLAGRIDKKEAHIDAGLKSLVDGLKDEIARLSDECRALRKQVSEHGRELAECRRKHAESEAEVMQLKAQMQGYGKAREDAALIVASERAKDKHRPGNDV